MARHSYSKSESFVVKTLLLLLNLLFLILGSAILGLSLYAKFGNDAAFTSIPSDIVIGGIIIGGILFAISLIGFGAMQSRSFMVIYVLTLLIIIAGQLAVGVMAYQKTLNPENALNDAWNQLSTDTRLTIQTKGECCGFFNPLDRQVVSDVCPVTGLTTRPGCYPRMKTEFEDKSKIIYITLFSIMGLEVITLLFCFMVLCNCFGIYKNEDWRLREANRMNRREPIYI